MIHLDTTLLVDLLREERRGGDPYPDDPSLLGPAHAFLAGRRDQPLAVSVHVSCELWAGAECASEPARERRAVDSLLRGVTVAHPDERFAPMYGELFAELRRRGDSIPAFDLLIGTAARVDDAPLVTRNTADFERIPGLHVLSY
ncbi:MAG: type II toxin-antitoxin system VapC family toxin [Thermoanaerobaculia bacterium]|nr:type II toxin-antitoxin system VapC family toxin [Thermoanaerobaculia bacterium]